MSKKVTLTLEEAAECGFNQSKLGSIAREGFTQVMINEGKHLAINYSKPHSTQGHKAFFWTVEECKNEETGYVTYLLSRYVG